MSAAAEQPPLGASGRSLTLANGRELVAAQEWQETTRLDSHFQREFGRWSGAADIRTRLILTVEWHWVIETFSDASPLPPYQVLPSAAANWFVACGLESEVPAGLREVAW